MSGRGGNSYYYGYPSPGGHGSSGEEGFISPRPQCQSSPRPYGQHGGQSSPRPYGQHGGQHGGHPRDYRNFNHHSNMSPIPHYSPNVPQDHMAPHNRSFNKGSPRHQSPGFHNNRGRGRGGRYNHNNSGGHSPYHRQDSNPGGSNDINAYFHPSMLEDPWAKLEPVPFNDQTSPT